MTNIEKVMTKNEVDSAQTGQKKNEMTEKVHMAAI